MTTLPVSTGKRTGLAGILAQAGGMLPTIKVGHDPVRQRQMNQQLLLRAQTQRPRGPWSALGGLASMYMLNKQGQKLDQAIADKKAAEQAKQGELLKAMLAAKQGGTMDDFFKTADYSNPVVQQAAVQHMGRQAPETWSVVQDPYGRGGVAQQSSRTGEIKGWQGPAKAEEQKTMKGQDGVPRYFGGDKHGQPVFPDVKAPGSTADLVRVAMPDGTQQAFRKDDPNLDVALRQGAVPFKANLQSGSVAEMGGKARDTIEGKLFNAQELSSRLKYIEDTFNPEFLTVPTAIKMKGLSAMEQLGGNLSPEQEAELGAYTEFRQNAVENMNLYIKEITGAQMSEPEANRLRKGVPDAEKDGPTQFKYKMQNNIAKARAAQDRYAYLLERGIRPETMNAEDRRNLFEKMPLEGFMTASMDVPDVSGLSDDEIRAKVQDVDSLSEMERDLLADEWDKRGLKI